MLCEDRWVVVVMALHWRSPEASLKLFSRGSADLIREGICGSGRGRRRGRVIGVESEPVTVATGDGGGNVWAALVGAPGVNPLASQ